jgi:hypothetical protein
MKILRLAQARVLLWARERSTLAPFEVSKIVGHPLQPLCGSSPHCPGETLETSVFDKPPLAGWVDPTQPPPGACPYDFGLRGECLQHRNQLALEAALFGPSEIKLTRRLLEALGYEVTEEGIDSHERGKILGAHGFLGPSHEVRLHQSPSAGPIVLVREMADPQHCPQPQRLEARGVRQP